MPKGELRFSRKGVCTSATPSRSLSRSRVIRLALRTPAPARSIALSVNHDLILFFFPGLGGALLSATRTSPFGTTHNPRGGSRPLAKAWTARPSAGEGRPFSDQPTAVATLTVGISVLLGSGSAGLGP